MRYYIYAIPRKIKNFFLEIHLKHKLQNSIRLARDSKKAEITSINHIIALSTDDKEKELYQKRLDECLNKLEIVQKAMCRNSSIFCP